MNLLIYTENKQIVEELMEKYNFLQYSETVVSSLQDLVKVTMNKEFEKIILNLTTISDIKILNFINRIYPNRKVLLFGDSIINRIIPIIQNSNIKMI